DRAPNRRVEDEGRRHSDPDLEVLVRNDGEPADEDALVAARGDEQWIAPKADDALVRLPDLALAGERRLAVFAVDPERRARDDSSRRKEDVGDRFRLTSLLVAEGERPFEVEVEAGRVDHPVHPRSRQLDGGVGAPVVTDVASEEKPFAVAAGP